MNSNEYLSTLHNLIDQSFSLEEVHDLCFTLGVDYDSISGNGKGAKIRELILWLARRGRLPDLLVAVRGERPNIDWPPIPDNFELPSSGSWAATPQLAPQTIVHGDIVHGDKTGGDKVGGDKITVGDISGSQGIAIGRGASANVSIQQGISGEELAKLFAPLTQQVTQAAPPEKKEEVVAKVKALEKETAKGEEADDEAVADLVQDIVDIVPEAVETITGLFTNSIISRSAGAATKFVLKRIRR